MDRESQVKAPGEQCDCIWERNTGPIKLVVQVSFPILCFRRLPAMRNHASLNETSSDPEKVNINWCGESPFGGESGGERRGCAACCCIAGIHRLMPKCINVTDCSATGASSLRGGGCPGCGISYSRPFASRFIVGAAGRLEECRSLRSAPESPKEAAALRLWLVRLYCWLLLIHGPLHITPNRPCIDRRQLRRRLIRHRMS